MRQTVSLGTLSADCGDYIDVDVLGRLNVRRTVCNLAGL